jgi:hypothetical protein
MSGSGVTYYNNELKELHRLLKHLPDTIPIGDQHDFIGYVPPQERVEFTGCIKTVVNARLEIVFGARRTGAGENVIIKFKSRGPALEAVISVLRDHITGNGGENRLLTHWVDDLIIGAREAITAAGNPVRLAPVMVSYILSCLR